MIEAFYKIIAMFKSFKIDPRLIFLYAAQNAIGKKLCPGNEDLGCVETWQNIHSFAFGHWIGATKSTIALCDLLLKNPTFVQVVNPLPGDTILSVTNGSRIGHIGILLSNGTIASNNSSTGQLDTKYTLLQWRIRWSGLRLFYFRKIISS